MDTSRKILKLSDAAAVTVWVSRTGFVMLFSQFEYLVPWRSWSWGLEREVEYSFTEGGNLVHRVIHDFLWIDPLDFSTAANPICIT